MFLLRRDARDRLSRYAAWVVGITLGASLATSAQGLQITEAAQFKWSDETSAQIDKVDAPYQLVRFRQAYNNTGASQVEIGKKGQQPKNKSWWKRLIGILDRHNGTLNAAFSALVAFFTLALVIVGNRQHKAAMAQIKLARDEFNATHRPRLVIRDLFYDVNDKDERAIHLSIVNIGDATGKIVEKNLEVKIVENGTFAKNILSKPIVKNSEINIIAPGRQIEISVRVLLAEQMMMLPTQPTATLVTGSVHLLGNIVYEDNMGRRRRTLFQRKHVRIDDVFVELGNPNYEYAD